MAAHTEMTPLSISRDAPGVLLFGGSFDPPHRWHVSIAAAARELLFGPLGCVLMVPAARNPLKDKGPNASDADRVAMLRLATREVERVTVWTDELDRAGRSFTIDTVKRLRSVLGEMPIRLLIGADQAADFHRWREYRQLLELAEPAVVLRPPVDTAIKLALQLDRAGVWTEEDVEAWTSRIVPGPVWDVSSTSLRAALASAAANPTGSEWSSLELRMDSAVLTYIREHGLYRAT